MLFRITLPCSYCRGCSATKMLKHSTKRSFEIDYVLHGSWGPANGGRFAVDLSSRFLVFSQKTFAMYNSFSLHVAGG